MIYRTDGAWGSGKGTNLAPAEVDGNFFELDGRVGEIEENPIPAITPISISIEGGLFSMGLSDGTTIGPILMTMPVPQWRGEWAPGIDYQEMDFFTAPDGGFGAVMVPHTSTTPFDWGAVDPDSGLPLYKEIVGGSGTTAALGDLVDVAVTGGADGDFLIYNLAASLWQNRSKATVATTVLPAFGGDAGTGGAQGMVPAPASGDAAAGKVLGAGGHWVVPAGGSGGSSSLAGLSDVAIVSPSNNSLLQYQASDGKWHNQTLTALGAGTVTEIDTADGISGGPITATGTIRLAQIATLNLLANLSGSSAAPAGVTLSALLDTIVGSDRGNLLRRSVTGWAALAPGTSGQYLKTGGIGADPSWDSPVGSGTVTSVAAGTGLAASPSPITATGTLSLAQIADQAVLANISGTTAAPSGTSLSGLLDTILGSGRGQIIYRGASTWSALSPGTNGYYLQTRGAGNDPLWSSVKGGGGAAAPPSLWHSACDYATTGPLPANTYSNGSAGVGATLTGTANGALSIDGSTVVVAQRILVKDEAVLTRNGCYTVTAVGSGAAPYVLTRATDYDEPSEVVQGTAFPISNGAINDATAWVLIVGGTTIIGSTALEFEAITATMPVSATGQVLGNPYTYSAPALPTSLSSVIDRALGAVQGSVLYRGASAWAALGPGTAGQVLTTGGAAANPSWAPAGGASLPSGATHDQLVYVSGAWSAQRPRYVVGCFVPGVPTASQLLLLQRLSKAITLPANFGAYLGHASQARGTVNATASTAIDVQKATSAAPGTFSSVGTITIAAGAMVGTFATSGGTAVTFAQGDSIALVGPGTPDTTFANFAATLVGYET